MSEHESATSETQPLLGSIDEPHPAVIPLHPPEPVCSTPSRKSRFLVSALIFPARLSVAAVTFFVSQSVTKSMQISPPFQLLTSCISVTASQLLISAAVRSARRNAAKERAEEAARHTRIAWLDAIQAVGKIVHRFSHGLLPPPPLHHIFLDVSLLRLLHTVDADKKCRIRSALRSDETSLIEGAHFFRFGLATYGFLLLKMCGLLDPNYNVLVHGARGLDVAKFLLRLSDEHILTDKLDGEAINLPRHFVARDDDREAFVVAIRGTNSISDLITDLLCENEPFAGGYAHSGMKAAADLLFGTLQPVLLAALESRPSYTIVVTGHSLGAGVAILLTKMLLMGGFENVKCFAIAPCPVFGPLHAVDSDWSSALHCFVHCDDLVARLCLSSAKNLALGVAHVSDATPTISQKKKIVNEHDDLCLRELLARESRSTGRVKENNVEQLYIPALKGVHWLIPTEDEEEEKGPSIPNKRTYENIPAAYIPTRSYTSYVVSPRNFEKILVTSTCASDHFPNCYTGAFSGLDIPLEIEDLPAPPVLENFSQPWYSNEFG